MRPIPHHPKKNKNILLAVVWTIGFCLTATAAGPAIWTVNGRSDVLKGEAKGVSIDQNGTITLAPGFSEVFKTAQPYIWSTAADTAGNIFIGTGSDGKIFKVDAAGKGSLFADLAKLNVTALAIGKERRAVRFNIARRQGLSAWIPTARPRYISIRRKNTSGRWRSWQMAAWRSEPAKREKSIE